MKIEVWSDTICPFCYIGKRKLEKALAKFGHQDEIEVLWKSFQLNPNIPKDLPKSTSMIAYLAASKSWSIEESIAAHKHVTKMAAQEGLEYNFDKAIVANSMDANRFIHLAQRFGVQNEAEELFFKAYFSEGKDIADLETLVKIGAELGIEADVVREAMNSDAFQHAVNQDIQEAQAIGVRGVPFFVFDRKFAISGAQADAVFEDTLKSAFESWKGEEQTFISPENQGDSCDLDGDC